MTPAHKEMLQELQKYAATAPTVESLSSKRTPESARERMGFDG